MNIALWIVQVLLALMFITVGRAHAFSQDQMKTRPGLGWVADVPKPLMTFIGVSEIAGGLGVVLPMLSVFCHG